ncbi:PREDICTED: clusterin-associated protein 1 [Nicrophorus vespilloides]|uniref:Clusterin-associated protein 1 n=1 Tax=Nicrophorus vespilloides TaxID=110193 RepID=A0ABM1MBS1_NICVS|nr:PREDICTED: clusterin-associated protein 1 [Nicrophorus vespilloides]
MSYRDVRNFTEMLRTLGYPALVSMESFRKPNFPLVANLLVWLAKRFEPDADISGEIDTETERIALIRSAAQFMALKANIKLNTKRLYQADGYAVKEILKISSVLYEALMHHSVGGKDEEVEQELSVRDFDISDKIHDLKQSRQLATEITTSGASLFDLLGKEIDLRGLRQASVGRNYEVADVEASIRKAIESLKANVAETMQMIDNVSATEGSLDAKIERRKVEIDRYEKRLQTLKKVRPAFLEEFTGLEEELNKLFAQYSVRLRCLTQLERLAAEAERVQIERQQLASSQQKIEPIAFQIEESNDQMMSIEEPMINAEQRLAPSRQERPRARTGGRTRMDNSSKGKVFGSMSVDEESSDSDDIFLDNDEPELLQSDEEDSLSLALDLKRAPSARISSSIVQDNSDDDF